MLKQLSHVGRLPLPPPRCCREAGVGWEVSGVCWCCTPLLPMDGEEGLYIKHRSLSWNL